MNKIILSGFLLPFLAGAALAQEPPVTPPSSEPPTTSEQPTQSPTPRDPQAGEDRYSEPYHRGDERGRSGRDHFGFHGRWMPPPSRSKAAHFSIVDGNTKINIKCADDEPTKVCADLLLQILDKLSSPSRL
jgi:hypothetical protein